MSTAVGDEPTRDGRGSGVPGRSRRGRDGDPDSKPITVEQLLARQGGGVTSRRASRRAEAPVLRAPAEPPPAVRAGMPPVPGAAAPARRDGLPPVPGAVRAGPQAGLPPVPVPARPPVAWQPDSRPSRRSGPVPPLPGQAPDRERTGTRRPAGRAAERTPAGPGRRRLRRALVALGAVVGVVLLYHLGLYFYVDQKIDRIDALAVDGPEILAPALQAGDETYLVVGSGVPGQTGTASVATLLASVSADGDRAVLVSFPPTALVDTPACRTPDGSMRQPATEAFATSLLEGGPSCLVRTVQQLSGLRVDHYLGMDLADLPGMVDALGGVPVCVIPSLATASAATPLPPGTSEIDGAAAEGYLQPGASGADVTGTAVAERAQRLLTATLRAAMSASTLADPLTLNRFLNRAAEALTVDEQTTLGDLRTLADSLGDLSGDAVQRAALPVEEVGHIPAGTDQAYVLLDGTGTRALFDAVIEGTQVPEEFTLGPAAAPAPAPAPAEELPPADVAPPVEAAPATDALTVPPASVSVDVLNGTGTSGLAATVADLMAAQGFVVGAVGNEPGTVNQSVVRYGPNVLEQARTVAASVPGAALEPSDSIGDAVQLVVGPGYETVVPVTTGAPAEIPAADVVASTEAGSAPAPVSC